MSLRSGDAAVFGVFAHGARPLTPAAPNSSSDDSTDPVIQALVLQLKALHVSSETRGLTGLSRKVELRQRLRWANKRALDYKQAEKTASRAARVSIFTGYNAKKKLRAEKHELVNQTLVRLASVRQEEEEKS